MINTQQVFIPNSVLFTKICSYIKKNYQKSFKKASIFEWLSAIKNVYDISLDNEVEQIKNIISHKMPMKCLYSDKIKQTTKEISSKNMIQKITELEKEISNFQNKDIKIYNKTKQASKINNYIIDRSVNNYSKSEDSKKEIIEFKSASLANSYSDIDLIPLIKLPIQINTLKNLISTTEESSETIELHMDKFDVKIENLISNIYKEGEIQPQRKEIKLNRVERSMSLVTMLKRLYIDTCQICGERLQIGYNNFYSEVHHIKPLGYHNGDDIAENAIVLCSNCHTLFDRGVISIDLENKMVSHFDTENVLHGHALIIKHRINKQYVDYHNNYIFIAQKMKHDKNEQVDARVVLKNADDVINYGDKVLLFNSEDKTVDDVVIETQYNECLMTPIQKKLLHRKLRFCFNGFHFEIKDISKNL